MKMKENTIDKLLGIKNDEHQETTGAFSHQDKATEPPSTSTKNVNILGVKNNPPHISYLIAVHTYEYSLSCFLDLDATCACT
jgi:hypothetical protein